MIKSIKELLFGVKKLKIGSNDYLKINVNGKKIIELIKKISQKIYKDDKIFIQTYLLKIITMDHPTLEKEINKFVKQTNCLFFHKSQQIELIQYYLTTIDSFFKQILIIWQAYMQHYLNFQNNIYNVLRREIALFSQLIIQLFKQIHHNKEYQKQDNSQDARLFRIKILDLITDNYRFEKICQIFNANMDNGKGKGGNFSPSEITQTKQQFQELLKFKQIPAPFNESIKHLIQFYHQYRIINKVLLLVSFVDKVRQQIQTYRTFFNMKDTAFGSDQIMAIVNFISQSSGKNIYASTQYIKAILSGPLNATELEVRDNLLEIDEKSDYCFHLLEAVSTVYCHISQFII